MGDGKQVSMSIVIVSSVIRIVMAKPPGPSGPGDYLSVGWTSFADWAERTSGPR